MQITQILNEVLFLKMLLFIDQVKK